MSGHAQGRLELLLRTAHRRALEYVPGLFFSDRRRLRFVHLNLVKSCRPGCTVLLGHLLFV